MLGVSVELLKISWVHIPKNGIFSQRTFLPLTSNQEENGKKLSEHKILSNALQYRDAVSSKVFISRCSLQQLSIANDCSLKRPGVLLLKRRNNYLLLNRTRVFRL